MGFFRAAVAVFAFCRSDGLSGGRAMTMKDMNGERAAV
jgi:hypothetical protein